MSLSRRRFGLGGLASALGGLLLPRTLRAAPASDRKFLFVYAVGGWDPTYVFAPRFGLDGIDMDPLATSATVNGLTFTDAESRPGVRAFFEAYGDRTAFLNGFEVRSVTHERCRRILFTGSSGADADDWPSIAAGHGDGYVLPNLVLSGPSYTSTYGSTSVRVGENGQLAQLLDGTAFVRSDQGHTGLDASANALVEARVRARVEAAAAAEGPGRGRELLSNYAAAMDQASLVAALVGDVDLAPPEYDGCTSVGNNVLPGLTCLERGYARSVVVQHAGFCDLAWDTHSDIEMQGTHFELLFEDLATILAELDARTGTSGLPLSEEVTVVVLSEMGRTPKLNATGGKDHWTFTSAMLVGAGVAGGRVIGGYDDTFAGQPVDLATGEVTGSGTSLTAAHLGATLLAMADVDPGEYTDAEPILGILG